MAEEVKKKCVIICASPYNQPDFIRDIIGVNDYVICADGGFDTALKAGIKPDIVIGDFDSKEKDSNIENDAQSIVLPTDKDDTDGIYCVKYGISKGFDKFYFIRVKTMFHIREGKLPFIQIKGNLRYKATEMLESSDIYDKATGKYVQFRKTLEGDIVPTYVILTMTMIDWQLFKEHYYLLEPEILDGCYFNAKIGIFDEYINKYKKIKLESTGALRELAKLFLNNLYGKMASNTDSSFKVAKLDEDGVVKYFIVNQNNKIPGYIPVGSAITSYARNFTIRAAQKNYHGVDNPGFIYADTDSIHCDLEPDDLVGVIEDPKEFCCWKFESCWDKALFVRQKTYIEHVTHENREAIENPYYNVKCAGMPERSKNLFLKSIGEQVPDEEYTDEEKDFLKTQKQLTDFKRGLIVPGKLIPKRIPGGVLLTEVPYEMRF